MATESEKQLRKYYHGLIVRMEMLLGQRPKLEKSLRRAKRRGRLAQIRRAQDRLDGNLRTWRNLCELYDRRETQEADATFRQ